MVTYIIGGLALTVALMGWGLKHQIGENAVLEQEVKQAAAVVEAKEKEIKVLNATMALNTTKKEIVYRDREVIKRVIKEVQINAKPEDCINQPVPDELNCVFSHKCAELPGLAEPVDTTNP